MCCGGDCGREMCVIGFAEMWDVDSLLVQEAESCDEKLTVELQQLE